METRYENYVVGSLRRSVLVEVGICTVFVTHCYEKHKGGLSGYLSSIAYLILVCSDNQFVQ